MKCVMLLRLSHSKLKGFLGDFCVITCIFLVAEAWASKPVSLIEVERTGELIWGRNVKEEKNHFAQSVR